MQLTEKYRPRKFGDVVGQPEAMNALLSVQQTSGLKGQVFWITGESATGKTTIARIIAAKVADPLNTEEIDAQDVSLDMLRGWERNCEYRPLMGDGYCFIINESHGLSSRVVSRLQTLLENDKVQRNATWLFTTTNKGHQRLFDSSFDSEPFLSRAVSLRLVDDERRRWDCATRLQDIANTELPGGQYSQSDCLALLNECNGNMRAAIGRIASGDVVVGQDAKVVA